MYARPKRECFIPNSKKTVRVVLQKRVNVFKNKKEYANLYCKLQIRKNILSSCFYLYKQWNCVKWEII